MSAHVLLNLLNKLGERDEIRGLQSILYLFCNQFNKLNSTRARMLESILLECIMYPFIIICTCMFCSVSFQFAGALINSMINIYI